MKTTLSPLTRVAFVAALGVAAVALCHAEDHSFEAEGEVQCSVIEAGVTNNYSSQFHATVSGSTTLIRARLQTSDPDCLADYYEYYSQGSNSTLLVRYADDLMVTNITTTSGGVEKTVTLKKPQRPSNQATVFVRPDPLPPYGFEHLTAVWLAFGSRSHFPATGQGAVDPVVFVEKGFRESQLKTESQWTVEARPPGLLKFTVEFSDGKTYEPGGKANPKPMPAPYDTGFTNAIFRTLEWTNMMGLRLPRKFELVKFQPDLSSKTEKKLNIAYRMLGEAHSYIIGKLRTNLVSVFPKRSNVIDYRFPDAGSRTDYSTYNYSAPEGITLSAQELLKPERVAVGAKTDTPPVSSQKSETVIPAGSLNFAGIEVAHFLQFYAAISNAQLDTNQLGEVRARHIAFTNINEVTRSEAIRLFDKALYDQTGIVATHPDAEHVVFRFRSSGDGK